MQHTILIIEPYKLLAYGLQLALRRGFPDSSVQLCVDLMERDALRQHITFVAPDIIIADPLLTGVQYHADLLPAGKEPTLIAINHSLLPENLYKGYSFVCLPTVDPQSLIQQIQEAEQPEVETIESEESKQTPLSQRECEVVAWVARGLTNKEIADVLHLSPHTVVTHRRNIATKLDIHSPSGLTIYALMNNLISMDEAKGI
ncbi:MAG: helix-turn-helix transcriptional regulator [Porphyromonas sp.]|uniref:helix-turn-helix transcriptional regulator n=1 Tax=Porphyromonas sp. TaxID=1924944 RepID=UPI001A4DB7EE|nr:LuxR C-terminal-related transcriptional regulator [Porphyromonas sp.]MBL6452713.1 helix-turn-helix transcriptional regulator [Porphyromonas sp.]